MRLRKEPSGAEAYLISRWTASPITCSTIYPTFLLQKKQLSGTSILVRKAKTYKKSTPPREKYALVLSGTRKNTVPMMTAWMINDLGTHH